MGTELLLATAFAFGVTNKLADLMNEHGVYWFKTCDLLLGVIWGTIGAILIISNANLAAVYLSLTLSWFLSLKLDYPNHAIAGVIMVLAAVWVADHKNLDVVAVVVLMLAYTLSHFIHRRLKGRNPDLSRFLRLRLRLYLIPLIFSLAVGDPVPFLATLSGMIGVEIITNYYHYVKGVA